MIFGGFPPVVALGITLVGFVVIVAGFILLVIGLVHWPAGNAKAYVVSGGAMIAASVAGIVAAWYR